MLTTGHIAPGLLEPKDWQCEPLWPHHQSVRGLCRSWPVTLWHHPSPHLTFSVCFNYFIYFNWRAIILQYCGGFCHTSSWISHECTCVRPILNTPPPPSPSHPTGLYQSTSFGCPALCIELALVIYFTYGNIHVSMPTCLLKMLRWNPSGSSGCFRHEARSPCRTLQQTFLCSKLQGVNLASLHVRHTNLP